MCPLACSLINFNRLTSTRTFQENDAAPAWIRPNYTFRISGFTMHKGNRNKHLHFTGIKFSEKHFNGKQIALLLYIQCSPTFNNYNRKTNKAISEKRKQIKEAKLLLQIATQHFLNFQIISTAKLNRKSRKKFHIFHRIDGAPFLSKQGF